MNHFISKAQSATLALFFLLTSCSSTPEAGFLEPNPFEAHRDLQVFKSAHEKGRSAVRVIFAGNVNGYLGTCGCSINPKGGADRRLNALQKLKGEFLAQGFSEERLLVLDAGNALFPGKKLDPTQKAAELKRVKLFQETQTGLGIQAQNVGINDLAMGYHLLTSDTVFGKYISSNIVTSAGQNAFKSELYLAKEKVLVLGFTEATRSLPDGLAALDPLNILKKRLANLSRDHLVIVLSDLGQRADRELAEAVDFPLLVIGGREPSSLEIPLIVGKSMLVQNQIQGQQWGVLDVSRAANDAQGWFSPELGQKFYTRWKELGQEEKTKSGIKNKEEREYEFDKLSAVSLDLKKYVPGKVTKKNYYSYTLLDMTEKFGEKNALTQIIKQSQAEAPTSNADLSPVNIVKPAAKKKTGKRRRTH